MFGFVLLKRLWRWLLHGPEPKRRAEPEHEPSDPHTPPLDREEDRIWLR